jgi:hypothetical protein
VSDPSPRQVLYALVAGGFLLVVATLVIGAALAGLVPAWWTAVMAVIVVSAAGWSVLNWRRTWPVLLGSIGVFAVWAVGTLMVGGT